MKRPGYALVSILAAAAFSGLYGLVARFAPEPRLLWNASGSAPIGLYRIHPGGAVQRGDLVAVRPPPELAQLLAERHALPPGLPLLKRLAATAGAIVCRRGDIVTIGGKRAAIARAHDSHGRALPAWRGCRTLKAGDLFLLNPAADSFDSRYFGPIPMRGLIGRATPILTRDAPGAPLKWRGLSPAPADSPPNSPPAKGSFPCK